MKGSGRIVGYAVNRKTISVKIEMSGAAPIIDELDRYKGKMKTIRLDAFQLVGKIESITISRNVGIPHSCSEARFHQSEALPSHGEGISRHRGEHDAAGQAPLLP